MNFHVRKSVVAVLSVMVLASPLAFAQTARVGTLKHVSGDVIVQTPSGPRKLDSGDGIAEGQKISTGSSGVAALTMRDGAVVTMGPGSTMEVSRFAFNGTTQQGEMNLNLLAGTFRMVSGLLSKLNPELVQVRTPTATVGTRGTDFIVEVQ